MQTLPFIDEHAVPVDAAPERVWEALVRVVRRSFGGAGRVAALLGCEPAVATPGFDGGEGQTLPGFRVAEATPGARLALVGRHRFSRYSLTFTIEDGSLRAETRAAFPGLAGRLYRAAVIGTRGHRLVTRRLLRATAGLAQERAAGPGLSEQAR